MALGIVMLPDGIRALSGSWDAKAPALWDVRSGKCLRRYVGHNANVWPVAVTKDGSRAVSGSNDGELRLWDNEILMGWYASTEGAIRDKGTMYFVLHPHGQRMSGRWVGLSNDGKIVTGWGSMAKEHDDAEAVIAWLDQEQGEVEAQ